MGSINPSDTLETVTNLSKLLDCGLDKEAVSICLALIENGVNPEALAEVIKRLRDQADSSKIASKVEETSK